MLDTLLNVAGKLLPYAQTWLAGENQRSANEFNSAEAIAAYNRSREARRTAYQDTMDDLRASGLNPMLAINNGVTQLPSSMAASYPVGAGAATANVLSSARSAGASEVSSAASATQAATAARVGDETVKKIKQEVVNLESDNKRVLSVVENLRLEYQNLVKQGHNLTEVGNQIRATIDKLRAEVPLIRSEQFLVEARKVLTDVQSSLTGSQKRLVDVDVRAAEAFGELGRTTKELEPFLRLIWNALVRR